MLKNRTRNLTIQYTLKPTSQILSMFVIEPPFFFRMDKYVKRAKTTGESVDIVGFDPGYRRMGGGGMNSETYEGHLYIVDLTIYGEIKKKSDVKPAVFSFVRDMSEYWGYVKVFVIELQDKSYSKNPLVREVSRQLGRVLKNTFPLAIIYYMHPRDYRKLFNISVSNKGITKKAAHSKRKALSLSALKLFKYSQDESRVIENVVNHPMFYESRSDHCADAHEVLIMMFAFIVNRSKYMYEITHAPPEKKGRYADLRKLALRPFHSKLHLIPMETDLQFSLPKLKT